MYVKLPPEDESPGMCGRLNVSLYGTRDAASNWEHTNSDGLIKDGWSPGVASPCCFYHNELEMSLVIHGDDFTFLGTDDALDQAEAMMKKRYEVKIRGRLGPQKQDDKSIRLLNRIITWDEEGITWEADQRHAEIIFRELDLAKSAALTVPGAKNTVDPEDEEPLSAEWASKYGKLGMRANFLAIDRTDIQYSVKEIARDISRPRESSWKSLVRLGKYLKGKPRLVIRYRYQSRSDMINTFTDSDWVGDRIARKRTSGGLVQLGQHVIRSWSSTQTVIALSSGEAEFYSIVKGASQSIGVRSMLKDLGFSFKVNKFTDA